LSTSFIYKQDYNHATLLIDTCCIYYNSLGKHIDLAILTMVDFHSLWNRYGFSPEVYNLLNPNVDILQNGI
jgi:hypothetical protein